VDTTNEMNRNPDPSVQSNDRRRVLRASVAVAPVLMTVASRPVLGQACTPSVMVSTVAVSHAQKTQMCEPAAGLSPDQWKTLADRWPSPYVGGQEVANSPVETCTTTTTPASAPTRSVPYTSRTTLSSETIARYYRIPPPTTPQTTVSCPSHTSVTNTQQAAVSPSAPSARSVPYTSRTTLSPELIARYYGGSPSKPTPQPIASAPAPAPSQPSGTAYHGATTGLGGRTFGTQTMLQVIDIRSGGVESVGRWIVAALLNARSGRIHVLTETTVRGMWNDLVSRGYYEPTAGVRWGPAEIVTYIQTTIA